MVTWIAVGIPLAGLLVVGYAVLIERRWYALRRYRLDVLSVPTRGTINVHASLLPKYRGAAPIHRAVMAGETLTARIASTFRPPARSGPASR